MSPQIRVPRLYHFMENLRPYERIRSLRKEIVLLVYIVFGASLVSLLCAPGITKAIIFPVFVASGFVLLWRYLDANYTHIRIRSIFRTAAQWPVYSRIYPLYKWVDLYQAAKAIASGHGCCMELLTEHNLFLKELLQSPLIAGLQFALKPATMRLRKVGYAEEIFLPVDAFWLVRGKQSIASGAIIRVRLINYSQRVQLELATEQKDDAATLMDAILERAAANSIYRNHMISPVFQPEVNRSYRDDDSSAGFDLEFQHEQEVTDADIVLDDAVRRIIERTIIDFHRRREALMRVGLPGRRGILFHGPPGTGKTYTCKYIAHKLRSATTIIATGQALVQIKTICQLAKTFQPSLVILEDIDLMFAQRDMNPYTPILGELLDELDGFQANDQVIFLLTTNALERVETAIKDRPGRISQSIYLGPPHAALRQQYLRILLQSYNTAAVDLDQVVAKTEGVSQAFLRELVFRAVQIATETGKDVDHTVVLTQADLVTALNEMTTGSGRWGKRIIGFQV